MQAAAKENSNERAALVSHAPEELTGGPLRRLGEGIGKVVYASEHWVVRRERSGAEILALIVFWKLIRRVEHLLPGKLGERLLEHPSKPLRFVRIAMQAVLHVVVLVVPRSIWFATHAGGMWTVYRRRGIRGEKLAARRLHGTSLVPERIEFPPVRVQVRGWPGWLTVSEATERVEATLHRRLLDLSLAGRLDEVECWLDRFLELRQAGWKRGVFSVDAHLKNFGVTGDRVVLLDAGGLTDRWHEIEDRLSFDDAAVPPHVQLGLGPMLAGRPDIAVRFDARWRAIVNVEGVRSHWPSDRHPG